MERKIPKADWRRGPVNSAHFIQMGKCWVSAQGFPEGCPGSLTPA